MDKYIVNIIARWIGALVGLAILASWLYPIWNRPDVAALGVAALEVLIIVTVLCACALAVGYVYHRVKLWEAARPNIPNALAALPAQLAYSVDAVHLAAEEEAMKADDTLLDDSAAWNAAVTKFALLGNLEGFGWRALCKFVGQADWKILLGLMVGAGVLTPPRGARAAQWAGQWCYSKFRLAVKYGRLALPFPEDMQAPVVTW